MSLKKANYSRQRSTHIVYSSAAAQTEPSMINSRRRLNVKKRAFLQQVQAAIVVAAALTAATPAFAQVTRTATAKAALVEAGNYEVDNAHTQVIWTVDHLAVSPLSGAFGASGGMLKIDPARPSDAEVNVTFNVAEMSTTTPAFTEHLWSADFFDVQKFPTAAFTSTALEVSGGSLKITGNLTIKGVTKPVTLDAEFFGAAINHMSKKPNVGFSATTSIKRSDFGLGYGIPAIADRTDIRIAAAFERLD